MRLLFDSQVSLPEELVSSEKLYLHCVHIIVCDCQYSSACTFLCSNDAFDTNLKQTTRRSAPLSSALLHTSFASTPVFLYFTPSTSSTYRDQSFIILILTHGTIPERLNLCKMDSVRIPERSVLGHAKAKAAEVLHHRHHDKDETTSPTDSAIGSTEQQAAEAAALAHAQVNELKRQSMALESCVDGQDDYKIESLRQQILGM